MKFIRKLLAALMSGPTPDVKLVCRGGCNERIVEAKGVGGGGNL